MQEMLRRACGLMEGHALCKHCVVVLRHLQAALACAWRRFWRSRRLPTSWVTGVIVIWLVRASSARAFRQSERRARRRLAI